MNKSLYLFLTQLTVIVHLLFILFIVAGGFIAHKKRWIKIIHLCSLAWAIYAELSPGVMCPLTTLENYFGSHAGLSTYEEDFITRYLVPVIYQDSIPFNIQFLLVGIVIVINIVAYGFRLFRKGK